VAGGLSAFAAAAAITIAILGGGGAADRPPAPGLDQASLGPAMSPEAPSLVPSATVKWTDTNRAKWVSNHKRSIAFELPAENHASAWLTRVRPILVVRCLSNTTDAFVFTQVAPVIEPGDDTRTVRLQFDGEGEQAARWVGAADHDALFSPDPVAFARRLARAHTLRFGFMPHNGPPATIVFDVRGFDTRVGSIARTCRWR
jgi:hypothetical protein